jgi:SAM-dependent methyltransferase
MKDNFSIQASSYAKFRPVYPLALYEHLLKFIGSKNIAWDCGCGNGQVAGVLSGHFDLVIATDISPTQIQHAVQKPNVEYRVLPAEKTDIISGSLDLITVAQAIHWFNINEFYEEVRRVSKPRAILAIWCYDLPQINLNLNDVIGYLYEDILGDQFWDPERKLVEEHYQTIPFPFEEISLPEFHIQTQWNFDQLIGFLNSWSAVQHYVRKNNINPVEELSQQLKTAWGNEKIQKVTFPIYTRVGKVKS